MQAIQQAVPMTPGNPIEEQLAAENAELRGRLEEAEEMLRAIRAGEIDALIVEGAAGPQIYTLQGLDAEAARFRGDILAQVSEAVLAIDAERRVIYLNAAAERQYGVVASEALGRNVSEIFENRWVPPDNEATVTASIRETGHWRGENVHIKRSGQAIDVECSVSLLAEGHGHSPALLVVVRDITERKKAEEALRQNEALFFTIIEQAPGGVYVVDDEFRIMQINTLARPEFTAAEPAIGRDFGEVIGLLWGPELGPQIAEIFRHTLETGERYKSPRFTHERYDLGKEKSYDWETQRITLPNGKCGVVCYFTDTTERYAQEKALHEAKEAAEAANQSKDRFLAVLSHELRTPLTPVLMVAGELERDPGLRLDVREDIVMIKRNVELEIKLIDDLLDLSRITSGKVMLKIESVDLNEAVRQVCGICQPQLAEHQVNLKMDLDPKVSTISADPARLQQVLWNVVKNAIKFTPAAGTVRVSTARLDPERCEVRVKDSGIGIPPDVLPLIFNAFEQGDTRITKQFGGLGLGLAISRALIGLHGGTIRAESEGQGRGATFIVELPGNAAHRGAEAPAVHSAGGPDAKRLRLLLVEDHADTARALARFLSAAGMVVVTANDVASAIASAEREPFDLVLSDLGLPDGDGYQIMRAILSRRVIPGIAMSGYGMDEDIRRSREAGFTEHLVKPVAVPLLIAAIRRVTATGE